MPAGMTARNDLVWGHPILGCVPVHCYSWGHSQQRVMLAQTVVGAIRALSVHILPTTDGSQPFMRQLTRTLVTCPPDTQVTADCDPLVSEVLVFVMMPLPLQVWPEQADVWAC